jgi:hypothetical protein
MYPGFRKNVHGNPEYHSGHAKFKKSISVFTEKLRSVTGWSHYLRDIKDLDNVRLQQKDGINCGLFVIAHMKILCKYWCPPEIVDNGVLRKLVLKEFMMNKVFRDLPFTTESIHVIT